MGNKRKSTALDDDMSGWTGADGQDDEPNGKMVIRVRRGALRRFDQLKTKSAGLPVEIKWDRRESDRRTEPGRSNGERRTGERRQKPPFTWDSADFVVVGDTSRPDDEAPPEQPINGRRRHKP
ncbi:MAG TPA: hypothetical protein VFV95_16460 [Vicinamibacterales bacterium]|nr:hypothetical protein [Vicinamibacterales bacterium]